MTHKTEFSTQAVEAIKDAYQRGLAVGEAQGYNKCLAEVGTSIRKIPAAKVPALPASPMLQTLAPLSTTLEELDLELWAYNQLKRARINTIAEILESAACGEFYDLKDFGPKRQAGVIAKLAALGYDVPPDPCR